MEIEVLTICDNAQNYQDKLVVVGTFSTIFASGCPIVSPSFSLACRFRYAVGESGEKIFNLTFKDPHGKDVLPSIQAKMEVPSNFEEYYVSNLIIGFNSINFTQYGKYLINIETEGLHKEIPLFVRSSSK